MTERLGDATGAWGWFDTDVCSCKMIKNCSVVVRSWTMWGWCTHKSCVGGGYDYEPRFGWCIRAWGMIVRHQTNCVYREVVRVGGFPIVPSLLVPLYNTSTDNCEQPLFLIFFWLLNTKFLCLVLILDITLLLPITPTHNPTHYRLCNLIQTS